MYRGKNIIPAIIEEQCCGYADAFISPAAFVILPGKIVIDFLL